MSGFHSRLQAAEVHERDVLARLQRSGWQAYSFGQGLLPPELREVLKRFDTPMRWMPDVVAARAPYSASDLMFIDAKAGDKWRETGNHDVERSSAESARDWSQYTKSPYQFVFSDWTCATPFLLLKFGRDGQFRGSGSGTPFILISRERTFPFDAVFGEQRQEAAP